MNGQNKVLWVLGPQEYTHSGVYKYSSTFINVLKKNSTLLLDEFVISKNAKGPIRYIKQYLALPLYLFFKSRQYASVVVYEESLAYLFPFIRTKSVIIVHDVRTVDRKQKLGLIEYLYFKKNQYMFSFLKKFSQVVAVSQFTQNNIDGYGMKKNQVRLIYNSFDVKQFQTPSLNRETLFTKHKISLEQNRIYLLYVGSEETRKNLITILKLIKKFSSKYYLIKIGKAIVPENKKKHRDFVDSNNLKVRFLDNVSQEDLVDFYHCSDLMVCTSLYEGFGRTPIEAQCAGLPLVSTNKGALSEILLDSASILHNPQDIEELEIRITEALDSKDLVKMGKENSKRFDVELEKEKWISLLSED